MLIHIFEVFRKLSVKLISCIYIYIYIDNVVWSIYV